MPYYDSRPLPSPSAVPLQQHRQRKHRRGAVSLVVLLLVTALVGVGAWYFLAGRFTTTPDFGNLTQEKAAALAAQNGLGIAWAQEFSETVPVGKVTRTDPAAGDRVLRGGTVTAFLSKGPERYAVPSLVGRDRDQATQALTDSHLKVGDIKEVFDETMAVGLVVSASIDAGQLVKPGTPVDLDISKGPAPVKVVSFKNKPFADAQTYYQNAGLIVQRADDAFSSTIDAGNVISSDPKVGGSVEKGGTITFTVSKGPEMIAVPGVGGLSANDAKKALKDAGFKVTVRKTFFGTRVWGTDPGEGTLVPKGSTVTLILV